MPRETPQVQVLRRIIGSGPSASAIEVAVLDCLRTATRAGGSVTIGPVSGRSRSLLIGATPIIERSGGTLYLAVPEGTCRKLPTSMASRVVSRPSTAFRTERAVIAAADFVLVQSAIAKAFLLIVSRLARQVGRNPFGQIDLASAAHGLGQVSKRERRAPREDAPSRKAKPPEQATGDVRRAISIRQPWAELIMRGIKKEEYRSRLTHIRERVYVYASLRRESLEDEENVRIKHRVDVDGLPRGVLIGTVEIVDCYDNGSCFAYVLNEPERLNTHLRPKKQPQPCFFYPF